jgi:hypothetical protein
MNHTAPASDGGREQGSLSAGLPDIPTVDVDMAAHVILERATFPASRPSLSVAAGKKFVADRAPAIRLSLTAGLMLAMRFAQARLISVWGLLLAAMLCPAQVFAEFAVFSAFANFVSIAALMRLEAVFFQNSDQTQLGRIFRLAALAGAAFLGVVAMALLAVAGIGWLTPETAGLFLVSLAGRAILRLLWSEATAEGDFRALGTSNIVQALVQPVAMILLIEGLGATSLALFLADALGHAVAACYLIWRRSAVLAALVHPRLWSWRELLLSGMRWRDAPRLLLPSALLSYGFTIAPLLALPYGSNPVLAAQVALAMRLLDVPTQMFATVSVPLVLNWLRLQAPRRRQFWVRLITLGLLAGASSLFAAIGFGALAADAVLHGTQWQGIGAIVAIMTLFYGGIALVSPLHEIASQLGRPLRQFAINALALLAIVLAMLWFGALSPMLLYALGVISLLRMLAHVQFTWTQPKMPSAKPELRGLSRARGRARESVTPAE